MELQPLQSLTLADMVEQQILDFIRQLNLKPGEHLPKEIELAEKLQVSRNIIREALSRLRMMGIIDSRKQRGMVVGQTRLDRVLSKMIDPQFMLAQDADNLFELRLVIELGLAELLYSRRTPELQARLEAIVRREEAAPGDLQVALQADAEFHCAIYQATRNQLLNLLQGLVQEFFRQNRQKNFNPRRFEPGQGTANHRDILDVLAAGGPEEYRAVMRRHLAPHFSELSIDVESPDFALAVNPCPGDLKNDSSALDSGCDRVASPRRRTRR